MKKDDQIIISKLLNKIDLNSTESKNLIKSILNNNFNEIQTGIILTLLNIKKESLIEIHSFVEYLRSLSIKLKLKGDLMDTCGTGGDNKNSFNFSTATSILLSTFEINIAKHRNGPTGTAKLTFLSHCTRFEDYHPQIFENSENL